MERCETPSFPARTTNRPVEFVSLPARMRGQKCIDPAASFFVEQRAGDVHYSSAGFDQLRGHSKQTRLEQREVSDSRFVEPPARLWIAPPRSGAGAWSIDKHGIRAIAATFGLGDIADLPAQPCLASRVETGLPILADQLELIDGIERQISDAIGPGDIRARMTRDGIRVEVPETQLAAAQALTETLETRIKGQGHRFAGISPYKRGSAFLRDQT